MIEVNIYYKTGDIGKIKDVKKTETAEEEIILHIERHINRKEIKQIEIIEKFKYGEEIHTIIGKE